MKIRIFALARELGLDSKVLIELCEEAGIKLRNALATLTPDERDTVVAYVKNRGSGHAKPEPVAEPVPKRDTADVAGRVREIRTMAPRSQASERATEVEEPEVHEAPEQEGSTEDVAASAADDAASVEAPEEKETAPTESTEDAPVTTTAEATETEEESESVAAVEESHQQTDSSEQQSTPVTKTETPAAETVKPRGPRQRVSMNRPRDMVPIGSVKDREPRKTAAPAGKPRPNRPVVAAPPSYTPPVIKSKPKTEKEKVQKPDMALSDIVDRQSPLSDQLKQLKEARNEHEGKAAPRSRRTAAEKGSLIKALRDSRNTQRQAKRHRRKRSTVQADLKTTAQIQFPITVRNLSEAIGRPAKAIIGLLFKEGRMVTINDELVEEEALEIAMELGVDLEIKRGRDIEAELVDSLDHSDPDDTLIPRPPIITILGHVDHGKTTLVDRLRSSNVAAGEAGGITQHIAAYQVTRNDQLLTFVDTPGHAAFGEMRSRGASVTDIVVLVIAADDGIMPQTEECISHAKNAGVPIVVALNKMDLPGVDDQRVLQQLAQHELLPAEWGGDYEVVRTSGETGLGIDDLLETLLLTAEINEYSANPEREALGVCLEAFREEGRGVLAWMIVQKGTLRVGDNILCGATYGRIRAMYNDQDVEIESAGPSTPVRVAGLEDVPGAGVHFFVMKDIEEARQVAENRQDEGREQSLSRRGKPRTLVDILSLAREGEGVQNLPVIIKADTPGSLEALRGEISKFEHDEVTVSIIHEGVGGVNESDVSLASASTAVIIAFHVIAEERAEALAEQEGVEIRRYNIIYEVTEQIRQSLEGMLRPERVEVATGRAIVLRTFQISRFGTIAGCRVINGTISRDNRVHVIRDQTVLNDYRINSLKREKDDAKEVRDGMECGIRLEGFNDIKDGDLLEAFRIDEIARTLDQTGS